MNDLSSTDIDHGIDRIVSNLARFSGIQALYPNQRQMLHEFCKGRDIFYTGDIYVQLREI